MTFPGAPHNAGRSVAALTEPIFSFADVSLANLVERDLLVDAASPAIWLAAAVGAQDSRVDADRHNAVRLEMPLGLVGDQHHSVLELVHKQLNALGGNRCHFEFV